MCVRSIPEINGKMNGSSEPEHFLQLLFLDIRYFFRKRLYMQGFLEVYSGKSYLKDGPILSPKIRYPF